MNTKPLAAKNKITMKERVEFGMKYTYYIKKKKKNCAFP